MRIIAKTSKRWHENTIDTLGTLYEYSTTKFSDNKQSQVIDGELFYTYGSLKEKCESISNKLSKYGIGAGDKVAILSHNTPNWTVAFFACVAFNRIVVPIRRYSELHL
jgi:long-chain acyl-CoA synthetase